MCLTLIYTIRIYILLCKNTSCVRVYGSKTAFSHKSEKNRMNICTKNGQGIYYALNFKCTPFVFVAKRLWMWGGGGMGNTNLANNFLKLIL